MDISSLKNYKGITPIPVDFDEYWDRAIKEMNAVNPDTELTEAEFKFPGAECYDMYFTGVNGARIYAKHLRPQNAKNTPVILLFHGYSAASPDWFDMIGYVMAGFSVFALDCRGQGGKSEDNSCVIGYTYLGHIIRGVDEESPDKLLYRDIFLDTALLAKLAMDMDFTDETRVYAYGGSQGGALTLACAALVPEIKKAAAIYPFLSDYKSSYELNGCAFVEIKDYFRRFDPRHEREEEFFTRLGYIDIKNLAPRIKADTLVFTALDDTAVPPAGQFATYNALMCKKKHIIYPDWGHENLRGANDIIIEFFLNE